MNLCDLALMEIKYVGGECYINLGLVFCSKMLDVLLEEGGVNALYPSFTLFAIQLTGGISYYE